MSTYRSAQRDQAIANEYGKTQMACRFCTLLTDVDTLNIYGARCFDCYRAYCNQGRYYPDLTKEQRKQMAIDVRNALAGGLRVSPRKHLIYLNEKAAATDRPGAGLSGFLVASRRSDASAGSES